jgi:hypothetical protein
MDDNITIITASDYSMKYGFKTMRRIRGSMGFSHLDSYFYKEDDNIKYFFPLLGVSIYDKRMIHPNVLENFLPVEVDGDVFYSHKEIKKTFLGMQQLFCEDDVVDLRYTDNPDKPITVVKTDGSANVYQLSFSMGCWGKWKIDAADAIHVLFNPLPKRLEEGLQLEERIPYLNTLHIASLNSGDNERFVELEEVAATTAGLKTGFRTKKVLAEFSI